MGAGDYDRRVTIQEFTTTRDPDTNEQIRTWVDLAAVWAKRLDLRASERIVMGEAIDATIETVFTIRYRVDVDVIGRLVDENGRIYDVKGTREIGRRRELELLCRAHIP